MRRKPKQAPYHLPEAVALRWRRRHIDCATCPLYRLSPDEPSQMDVAFGRVGQIRLYTQGFCDWRPKIDGFPAWANEAAWEAMRATGRGFYSGNPRKGTCAAKPKAVQ